MSLHEVNIAPGSAATPTTPAITASTSETEIGALPLVEQTEKPAQDEKTPAQKKAATTLAETIKNNGAVYNQVSFGVIGQLLTRQKIGDEVIFYNIPPKTTLGEFKKQYNLPDGSLRHMVPQGGGDFDSYKIKGGQVVVPAEYLQIATGKTSKELKTMFPNDKVLKWNEFSK